MDHAARTIQTTLKHRMHVDDDVFVDFVESLLTYDQMARPSAIEALKVRTRQMAAGQTQAHTHARRVWWPAWLAGWLAGFAA